MVSIGIGVKVLAWPVSKKLKLIEPCVRVDCGRIMMTTLHHFVIQPNDKNEHLFSAYYVPGPVLRALHGLTHIISTLALSSRHCYSPLKNDDIEAQKS